ncbi:MAG: helix-turn-helix domain-containing protein [Bacteriovoracaceae bacterium]
MKNDQILHSLKKVREAAGLTQKDVERILGMRALMMRDYEVGRLKLPIDIALKLAGLYRVSLDKLAGNIEAIPKDFESKTLKNFHSLFLGSGFSVIFQDPVMRAFLEGHSEDYFEQSLFDLLTTNFKEKERKDLARAIAQCLFSLASADGRISHEEIDCIRYLLKELKLQNKHKEISESLSEAFYPEMTQKNFERIEIRHFLIWLLFLFADSDGEINYEEVQYIEKCAESLKINKSNFLFIKKNFIEEAE